MAGFATANDDAFIDGSGVHRILGLTLLSPEDVRGHNQAVDYDWEELHPQFLVHAAFGDVSKDDDTVVDDTSWVDEDSFFESHFGVGAADWLSDQSFEAMAVNIQSLMDDFRDGVNRRIQKVRAMRAAKAAARQVSPRGAGGRGRAGGRGAGRAGRASRGRGRGMAELMAGDSDEADEATDFQRVAAAAADAAAEADSDAEEPPHSSGRKRARPSM